MLIQPFAAMSSQNVKTIEKLEKIARRTEESVFQTNEHYLKFKAQKNIKFNEIDLIISEFYVLKYDEESIYWNRRVLDEKIGSKEKRWLFFNTLVHLYFDAQEYELALEYGQRTPPKFVFS